jgi:hypothetical protein
MATPLLMLIYGCWHCGGRFAKLADLLAGLIHGLIEDHQP